MRSARDNRASQRDAELPGVSRKSPASAEQYTQVRNCLRRGQATRGMEEGKPGREQHLVYPPAWKTSRLTGHQADLPEDLIHPRVSVDLEQNAEAQNQTRGIRPCLSSVTSP